MATAVTAAAACAQQVQRTVPSKASNSLLTPVAR